MALDHLSCAGNSAPPLQQPDPGDAKSRLRYYQEIAQLDPASLVSMLDLEVCIPRMLEITNSIDAADANRARDVFLTGSPDLDETNFTMPGVEVFEMAGAIKWFDVSKGYGFIVPDAGPSDILVHATVVEASGYRVALEGARLHVEIMKTSRGLRTLRVLSMDLSTAIHPSSLRFRGAGHVKPESPWVRALVKWFNRVRGFGFLSTSAGQDVFVHMETLRRFGIVTLNKGDLYELRYGRSPKGPVVSELRPLPSQEGWPHHM